MAGFFYVLKFVFSHFLRSELLLNLAKPYRWYGSSLFYL